MIGRGVEAVQRDQDRVIVAGLVLQIAQRFAPEPPGLLIGMNGRGDRPFCSIKPCIRRAI